MAWVFVAVDPEGRRVGLREDRWQQYILDKRPSLQNLLREIKEAITQPQTIYAGSKLFSLLYSGKPFPSGFHQGEEIRVAVSFDRAYQYGQVRTVYIASQPHKGGIVWPP